MRKRNVARRTSIVDSFHEPALRSQILVNAIQRCPVFATAGGFGLYLGTQCPYLDVPFLARPPGIRPPVAFSSPRSSEREDLPANTFATKERRLTFLKFDVCRKGWPVNAHGRSSLLFCARGLFRHFR